jgi:hypothetical protein
LISYWVDSDQDASGDLGDDGDSVSHGSERENSGGQSGSGSGRDDFGNNNPDLEGDRGF